MTSSELQNLLTATLAAAQRDASAETVARFCVAWARYRADYPKEGNRPFFDAARASGFKNASAGGSSGSTSLEHVAAALAVALDKCAGGNAGAKRWSGGEPRTR